MRENITARSTPLQKDFTAWEFLEKIAWIELKWALPSGAVQRIYNLLLNRYTTIEEGRDAWR